MFRSSSTTQAMLRASSSVSRMALIYLFFYDQITSFVWPDVARPFRAKLRSHRSFATVSDPPARRYGGLKDQDRIFTNVYSRHDHGIKGAQVYLEESPNTFILIPFVSQEVIGIKPKKSCWRVILGLSKLSRIPAYAVVAVPGFPVVWNGASWINRIGSRILG